MKKQALWMIPGRAAGFAGALLLALAVLASLPSRGQAAQDSFPVMVNQSGYNREGPKRFTVPLATGGERFTVVRTGETRPLFRGRLTGQAGDFTGFRPPASVGQPVQYELRVEGPGGLTGVSYPFSVEPFWQERAFFRPALDFMIDDRSVVGTHPSAYGGCPWRDGTYYSFEVPSLVMQLMANPALYLSAPPTIHYQADKARFLEPGFHYVAERGSADALTDVRRYYTELDPPRGGQVPDIVQLIHWGIGFYLIDPETADPSGDPAGNRIHGETVEQFAYFLYGFPLMASYFTPAFYQRAHDFCFSEWKKAGLLDVIGVIGNGKGRDCPGHSILPNLLLYEVARREGRADSADYLLAACRQTQWVIDSVDWHDPRTTKGQRMSEHKLMEGLAYLQARYPDRAPAGLPDKIAQWAQVMIGRSDNGWDFRRYDTARDWSIPEYNEPGNLAGFPAAALAAAGVLGDAATSQRLEQLAFAAMDNLFGRNPQRAASPNHPEMGFPYVERGWPKSFRANTCARLETVRGTLNASASTDMYPYNPNGAFRHLEGWTAFNAAWNAGLAYMSWHDTRLTLSDRRFRRVEDSYRMGGDLYVRLRAPRVDETSTAEVKVVVGGRDTLRVTLQPLAGTPDSYGGVLKWARLKPLLGGGAASLSITYGEGMFQKTFKLTRSRGDLFSVRRDAAVPAGRVYAVRTSDRTRTINR